MTHLALIVFLYYTSVWAIVSTLMVYVTTHLQFTPISLGWLLSSYGIATMFSEGNLLFTMLQSYHSFPFDLICFVWIHSLTLLFLIGVLVRLLVPRLGEIHSIRLGLIFFSLQCLVIAFSTTKEWIFISILFSMISNLVYPSISALVSRISSDDIQGEALGALNGIKALTEGFGPLIFGFLMGLFEKSPLPGAPYLIACMLSLWAFLHCYELPLEPNVFVNKIVRANSNLTLNINVKNENETAHLLSTASDD